jgi:hypothetical protein
MKKSYFRKTESVLIHFDHLHALKIETYCSVHKIQQMQLNLIHVLTNVVSLYSYGNITLQFTPSQQCLSTMSLTPCTDILFVNDCLNTVVQFTPSQQRSALHSS